MWRTVDVWFSKLWLNVYQVTHYFTLYCSSFLSLFTRLSDFTSSFIRRKEVIVSRRKSNWSNGIVNFSFDWFDGSMNHRINTNQHSSYFFYPFSWHIFNPSRYSWLQLKFNMNIFLPLSPFHLDIHGHFMMN